MKKIIPHHRPVSPKINQTRPLPSRSLAVFSIILMFASLGSFFITRSHAATLTVASEAEQGVIAGNSIARTNQTGASGNAAAEFGVNNNTGGGGGGTTGIDAPNNTGPSGIAGNWKIAFNDDFNGTTLNEHVWTRCNPSFNGSCVPFNQELQKFNTARVGNDNLVLSGGILHMVANKKNGEIWSSTISTGEDKFNYYKNEAPGFYKGFSYTYGVYEGRVKFPSGHGFWPSLWQLPINQASYGGWPRGGEYDVVEINGTHPDVGHFTVHKPGGSCGGSDCNGANPNLGDITTAFHTFSLDWEKDAMTWYYDGRQVHKVTDKAYIQDHAFYIIANFSMCPAGGGCWGGQTGGVDGSTPFPSSMDVDYLRVWQHQ